jgi:competence protein ComEA
MSHGRIGVVLAVIGVTLGGVLGMVQREGGVAQPSPASVTPETIETTSIEVHVGGWVVSPGVVAIPEGSIVADAIAAAGGLRPGASGDSVNLAAPVMPGQQIIVPGPGDSGGAPTDVAGSGAGGLVAINRATAAELETLPGVGPVLAARIVAHREQNGPFTEVEDLLQVSGIGESKLAAIRDLIVVP